jgi:carbamoyltransferase
MKNNHSVILCINYGGHDSSAAIMVDGTLVAACEQERFDLQKHSRAFPSEAISECLKIAGVNIQQVDVVGIPFDRNRYIRETYLRPALEDDQRITFLLNDIERIKHTYNMPDIIREKTGFDGPIIGVRHHLTHLASSYYPSGFERALLLSHDGMGDFECSMFGIGDRGKISIVHDTNVYPNSLGLLYSAITYYLGWKHHCDEGIIMGLAPYGNSNSKIPGREETYYEVFSEIIQESGPLDYLIGQSWIAYHKARDVWVSDKFKQVFGPKRDWTDPLEQHHKNIAAALQDRLEGVVLKQLAYLKREYDCQYLAVAGGVGLNCSMNGAILAQAGFDEMFVQPASGDAGCAIGACYLIHKEREPEAVFGKNHNFYLGSRFGNAEIVEALNESGLAYTKPHNLSEETARCLADGHIVGWFQGGAEFGPRALGNRSILCKPFPAEMKDHLNLQVKFRENFRPFAPAVPWEDACDYFEIEQESPHMLMAVQVKQCQKDAIPAVVHVDNSCRVQTVRPEGNERLWSLLQAFKKATGIPVLLNTSFNVKGQPIVNTPMQAIECFQSTKIDTLVLGDYMIRKPGNTGLSR